ncbi:MAG: hypothetical protein ACKOXB_08710 [Flavobacteriales bacterium]
MMRKIVIAALLLLSLHLPAQELFPLNEQASNVPKGVLGARAFSHSYKEYEVWRNMSGIRLMYGLLPRLTIMADITASNHHGNTLPNNLVTHKHVGNQTIYYVQPFQRGVVYPYLFNGIHLYAKFRFLSIDGMKTHFRGAAYAEWSNVNAAHDEAEPNLMDDTKGYGSGLIITYLKNHFAVSLSSGFIIPGSYSGTSQLSIGTITPIIIEYGKALQYNLSFGYLLSPKQYSSYQETSISLYAEFMGKAYQGAKVFQDGTEISVETDLLKAGNYVDVHPGIQFVFSSNTRLDLSVGLPLIKASYTHFYPYYFIAVQRYFYASKK